MNQGTHFFIKMYLSHFILEKGWSWLCVRSQLETGTDFYILTQVFLTIVALLSHLGWGCSTVGHWGPKALRLPMVLTSVSCPQLTLAKNPADYDNLQSFPKQTTSKTSRVLSDFTPHEKHYITQKQYRNREWMKNFAKFLANVDTFSLNTTILLRILYLFFSFFLPFHLDTPLESMFWWNGICMNPSPSISPFSFFH